MAVGESLDLLGSNVGQFRDGEDDDYYRLLIKVRIIINMSIGDIETINYVMDVLFKKWFISQQEVWPINLYENEPAAIILNFVDSVPFLPYGIAEKIKAAGVRIFFGMVSAEKMILESQAGDYTYPQFLCGLHDTGTIPRIRWEGQAAVIDVNLDTAIDDAKNYKPISGEKHTATQLYNDRVVETINMTSFNSSNVYSFEK